MTLYTKKQLAKELKVSKATVDNWMAKKKIKSFKMGNVVRFTEKHIEEFLKKGEAKNVN